MLQKRTYSLGLMLLFASGAFAQSRIMYVGDVPLSLGMSRDAAMRALTAKYKVEAARGGITFFVTLYDERRKLYNMLGSLGIENNEVPYISRNIDTSGWPNDEGFSVARALYDALNSSIDVTDRDGAKRASARILIDNQDTDQPTRGNIRTIAIFVNERKIDVTIWEGSDGGKSVSASMTIRAKPW